MKNQLFLTKFTIWSEFSVRYQIEIRYMKRTFRIEANLYFGHLVMFDLLFITNEWQIGNVKLKCPTFKKNSPIIGGEQKILSPPPFVLGVATLATPTSLYKYVCKNDDIQKYALINASNKTILYERLTYVLGNSLTVPFNK